MPPFRFNFQPVLMPGNAQTISNGKLLINLLQPLSLLQHNRAKINVIG